MGFDYGEIDYIPECNNNEDGLNYGLYYCSLCNKDTLHQVIDVDFDNYDIECSTCGTVSLTRADYFDSYEEESRTWELEIRAFMDDHTDEDRENGDGMYT